MNKILLFLLLIFNNIFAVNFNNETNLRIVEIVLEYANKETIEQYTIPKVHITNQKDIFIIDLKLKKIKFCFNNEAIFEFETEFSTGKDWTEFSFNIYNKYPLSSNGNGHVIIVPTHNGNTFYITKEEVTIIQGANCD